MFTISAFPLSFFAGGPVFLDFWLCPFPRLTDWATGCPKPVLQPAFLLFLEDVILFPFTLCFKILTINSAKCTINSYQSEGLKKG